MTSCSSTRNLVTSEIVRRDSILVVEKVRDTVVEIKPDSSLIRALLECDSLGRVRVAQIQDYERGKALQVPKITITDNVLTALATTDSIGIYLKWKERYEKHESSVVETSTVTAEVNRLTGQQKFWIKMGRGSVVVVLLLIGLKLLLKFK